MKPKGKEFTLTATAGTSVSAWGEGLEKPIGIKRDDAIRTIRVPGDGQRRVYLNTGKASEAFGGRHELVDELGKVRSTHPAVYIQEVYTGQDLPHTTPIVLKQMGDTFVFSPQFGENGERIPITLTVVEAE